MTDSIQRDIKSHLEGIAALTRGRQGLGRTRRSSNLAAQAEEELPAPLSFSKELDPKLQEFHDDKERSYANLDAVQKELHDRNERGFTRGQQEKLNKAQLTEAVAAKGAAEKKKAVARAEAEAAAFAQKFLRDEEAAAQAKVQKAANLRNHITKRGEIHYNQIKASRDSFNRKRPLGALAEGGKRRKTKRRKTKRRKTKRRKTKRRKTKRRKTKREGRSILGQRAINTARKT